MSGRINFELLVPNCQMEVDRECETNRATSAEASADVSAESAGYVSAEAFAEYAVAVSAEGLQVGAPQIDGSLHRGPHGGLCGVVGGFSATSCGTHRA